MNRQTIARNMRRATVASGTAIQRPGMSAMKSGVSGIMFAVGNITEIIVILINRILI